MALVTATPRPACSMARCWWSARRRHGPASCHRRAVRPDSGTWTATAGHARARQRSYRHAAPRWQGARCGRPRQPNGRRAGRPGQRDLDGHRELPKIRYHVEHAATLLPDGRVLVTGGPPNGREDGWPTAELYDPSSGSWTITGNMVRVRLGHTATLLPDGRVLVVGGQPPGATASRRPRPSCTTRAAGPGPPPRAWSRSAAAETATLLLDGRVLVAGGFRSDGNGCGFGRGVRPGHGDLDRRAEHGHTSCRSDGHLAARRPGARARRNERDRWNGRPQTTAEQFDPARSLT